MKISFLQRLLDLATPRSCAVCGKRLSAEEDLFCTACYLHLPLTDFLTQPDDNPMTRLFWGRLPIEKACALIYYTAHATSSYPIYKLKYLNAPDLGIDLGRYLGQRLRRAGFFGDIDALVPVPLTPERQRERGYNQSFMLAQGLAEESRLPVWNHVVRRKSFQSTQTNKGRLERAANVEGAFELTGADKISNSHVLIVDDVVTTGATVSSLGRELRKAPGVRLSVVSIGFAGGQS